MEGEAATSQSSWHHAAKASAPEPAPNEVDLEDDAALIEDNDDFVLDDREAFLKNVTLKKKKLLDDIREGKSKKLPKIALKHRAITKQGRGGTLSCVSLLNPLRPPCQCCEAAIRANRELEDAWQDSRLRLLRERDAAKERQRLDTEKRKAEQELNRKRKLEEDEAAKIRKAAEKEATRLQKEKEKDEERAEMERKKKEDREEKRRKKQHEDEAKEKEKRKLAASLKGNMWFPPSTESMKTNGKADSQASTPQEMSALMHLLQQSKTKTQVDTDHDKEFTASLTYKC